MGFTVISSTKQKTKVRHARWQHLLLPALFACLLPNAFGARVALVIGNGAYKDNPLKNPLNDARDMSAKLKELGFVVITRENLKRREITPMLREFRTQIKAGDEVLFFYAGHGVQVKGVNYLPTVDAEISSEEDVDLESLSVSKLLDLLDESKANVKLVFLDACRNNPYSRSFRSANQGLSRVGTIAPSGTLISFATKPGSVAADGAGRNGLYTGQLLKYMASDDLQIEQVLKNVIHDVKKLSNGQQEPWSEGSLEGEFYFHKNQQPVASASSIPPKQSVPTVKKADSDKQVLARVERDLLALSAQTKYFEGNKAGALADWRKYEKIENTDPDLYYWIGKAELELDHFDLAEQALKRNIVLSAGQGEHYKEVLQLLVQVNPLRERWKVETERLRASMVRYQVLEQGSEVKDKQTGLIWRRCVEGMSWDGNTCSGKYDKFRFEATLELEKRETSASKPWRMPTKDELGSLIFDTPRGAKIHTQAFPTTPVTWFWSSTPYENSKYTAWSAHFGTGNFSGVSRNTLYPVRLVRSGQ